MSGSNEFLQAFLLTKQQKYLSQALILKAEEEEDKYIDYNAGVRFDLNAISDGQSQFFFRFDKEGIIRITCALNIPNEIVTNDGSRFNNVEAMCILLRRFVYPNRLGDISPMFGRSKSQLSIIINWMLNYIIKKFGHLIEEFNLFWMEPEYLQVYADAVHQKGAALDNCVGFIDGTLRSICRPKLYQEEVYNGHKRKHGLKFQSIVMPNGLIAHLFGPITGNRHDGYMLAESKILPRLQQLFRRENNNVPFCIFGDPAYPNRPELLMPYRGPNFSPEQAEFNYSMSKVRQAVEWGFGHVISLFAFLDYKKNLKLFLQPVANYYKVAVLLTNLYTCIERSPASTYFGLDPPTVEEYLTNRNLNV